jgi:hypothetical protein
VKKIVKNQTSPLSGFIISEKEKRIFDIGIEYLKDRKKRKEEQELQEIMDSVTQPHEKVIS